MHQISFKRNFRFEEMFIRKKKERNKQALFGDKNVTFPRKLPLITVSQKLIIFKIKYPAKTIPVHP